MPHRGPHVGHGAQPLQLHLETFERVADTAAGVILAPLGNQRGASPHPRGVRRKAGGASTQDRKAVGGTLLRRITDGEAIQARAHRVMIEAAPVWKGRASAAPVWEGRVSF